MVKTLLFDFSRVLLHPKDKNYTGGLNALHKELSQKDDYQILNHFVLNDDLLRFLQAIKEKYFLYIFTTDIIQDDPEIRKQINPIFDKVFSANKLGLNKKDPIAYQSIAKDLNQNPSEILFIDDTIENIKAAEKAGLQTHHYSGNERIMNLLKP